jgi:hypothetical protein
MSGGRENNPIIIHVLGHEKIEIRIDLGVFRWCENLSYLVVVVALAHHSFRPSLQKKPATLKSMLLWFCSQKSVISRE